MPFRSGSIGYARFRVAGDVSAAPDEELFATLREHLVKPPSIGEPKELTSGFCTGRHVFDGEFTYDACGYGAALLAAMRLDVAKVPSEIKRAYRAMAEDARRGREGDGIAALSRNARREAKEEAEERCKRDLAEGKYRRVSMVPFLWDLPNGLLLAPLSSDASFQELKSLLDAACDVRLERRSAGTLALEILGSRGRSAALEDALPDALTDRPEGPAGGEDDDDVDSATRHFRAAGRPEVPWAVAAGEPNDFLGNLFLLWLWWHVDTQEGVIETPGPTVALAIERSLEMECAWGVTGQQSLRGDAPTRLPEAAKALQSGKWPRKMSLLLAAHGQEFRCALQGDRFAVSGLALPKGDEQGATKGNEQLRLTPRQVLEERIDQLLTFDRILVELYGAFLADRFGAGWETRAGQMREWIAAMGKRGGRERGTSTLVEPKPAAAARNGVRREVEAVEG